MLAFISLGVSVLVYKQIEAAKERRKKDDLIRKKKAKADALAASIESQRRARER